MPRSADSGFRLHDVIVFGAFCLLLKLRKKHKFNANRSRLCALQIFICQTRLTVIHNKETKISQTVMLNYKCTIGLYWLLIRPSHGMIADCITHRTLSVCQFGIHNPEFCPNVSVQHFSKQNN